MLKDPNNDLVTPYELVGLDPNAPVTEVQQALPRFMRDRRNLARIGKAQEAVRLLQNARSRADLDVWFYDLDISLVDTSGEADGAHLDVSEFSQVAVIEWAELYCDLNKDAMRSEFRDIPAQAVRFSDVKAFDGLDDIALRPRFDQ